MTIYIDPSASVNGVGSLTSPFNTWASVVWVVGETYLQKSGTTYKGTISPGADGVIISTYGEGRAIVDCENLRPRAIATYERSGCLVEGYLGLNCLDATFVIRGGSSNHIRNCVARGFIGYGVFSRATKNQIIEDCDFSSNTGDFTVGLYLDQACQGGAIRRNKVHDVTGDAVYLTGGCSGIAITHNVITGRHKDSLGLESAQNCRVEYNQLEQSGCYGVSYPAIKLGNAFDTGPGADGNIIRHNVVSSPLGSTPVQNYKAGAGNSIDRNTYIGSDLFGWNTDSDTIPKGNYTLAQLRAAGKYEQNE